jgi:hypothetical protein
MLATKNTVPALYRQKPQAGRGGPGNNNRISPYSVLTLILTL